MKRPPPLWRGFVPPEVRMGWFARPVHAVLQRHGAMPLPRRRELFWRLASAVQATGPGRDPLMELHPSECRFVAELRDALFTLYGDRTKPDWWVLLHVGSGGTSDLPAGIRRVGPDEARFYREARASFELVAQLAERELGPTAPTREALKKAARRLGLAIRCQRRS